MLKKKNICILNDIIDFYKDTISFALKSLLVYLFNSGATTANC